MRCRLALPLLLPLALTGLDGSVSAMPQDAAPRPVARPDGSQSLLRPVPRPATLPAMTEPTDQDRALARWIRDFAPRAQGISGATLEAAFKDVRYRPDVIEKDRNQTEFTLAIWDYLDRVASSSRIENGQNALREHAALFDQLEARFDVEKEVIAAVWGMESAYGTVRGDIPVIDALATLAQDGRRGAFFEKQLIAALSILQSGDVTPDRMTGSWAGAMGHTQFIPTSYLAYAVDANGDGRRDIWSDDPTDALASTSAYLARAGWVHGMPWGVEVTLPDGFDHALANSGAQKMPSDWARLGITRADGAPMRDHGSARLWLPAGADGPAFLTFKNFAVIARYNAADAYVLGVGHLSDRLAGAPALHTPWPRDQRALSAAERRELQQRLTAAGFSTKGTDGIIGPNSVRAIRAYQQANGLTTDGHPSSALLDH
ncbi:MAG: murein transglycosylase, partial [Rhodobacterales bacterium]